MAPRSHTILWASYIVLFLSLFIVIWSVTTQKNDIRNRAAVTSKCFSNVITKSDDLYWNNGCDTTTTTFICKYVFVKLTPTEELEYNTWVQSGKPQIPGCQETSTTTKTIINGPPHPPSGCKYQAVECVRAPCNPILVCPSPMELECENREGEQCSIFDCPVCLPNERCMMRPCMMRMGICSNNVCVHVVPTPYPIDYCEREDNQPCSFTICPTPVCTGSMCTSTSCTTVSGTCIHNRCQLSTITPTRIPRPTVRPTRIITTTPRPTPTIELYIPPDQTLILPTPTPTIPPTLLQTIINFFQQFFK